MGTPDYGAKILENLINSEFEVVAVFTQPDKPVGRKKTITPPPVKVVAEKSNIPVFQPKKLQDSADEVRNLSPDFIVVAAYGQILSREILDIAPAINLHTSILPKYRGASPIQQALLNGDSETGVTAMLMNEELDEGDILKIEKVQIEDSWEVSKLYEVLTDIAGNLTLNTLREFENISPTPQKESETSYCKKIRKEDGLVEWKDAIELVQKWKAFSFWPTIYLESGLKLFDVSENRKGNFKSGEILEISKDSVVVGCENGAVQIREVQPKSKKRMSIQSYLNGKRLEIGSILE
jgi:methionyl-tRNA formyltransferase